MPNIGDILQSKTGAQYKLVKQLGKGGEGTVYTTSNPNLVVKIYHPAKATQEIERKLLCMLKHPIDPMAGIGKLLIAWPQDVVYQNGSFVGYVMPLVADTHPIYIVCRNNEKHVHDCHAVFPNYDWRYSLMVAYHLAWAVEYVHKCGYVIGDMNSNNIVVHGDGSITILDVDSFDITDPDTHEHFPCTVGICEFLAPELQGRNLTRAQFTKHSDEFSLAVHIFILLMNNSHPFTMRHLTQGENYAGNVHTLTQAKGSTVQDQQMINIVNGYCPYIRNVPGYGIPFPAPYFSMLPAQIQTCFRQTFGYNETNVMQRIASRTTAETWRYYLYQYYLRTTGDPKTGKKADLIRCGKNREHFYLIGRGHCELCAAEKRLKDSMNIVITAEPWAVEILSTTTMESSTTTSASIPEGSNAFVHFRVSKGPDGKSELLHYSWTTNGVSSGKMAMTVSFQVGEAGYISQGDVEAGSHTVVIYDSNDKELTRARFTVSPRTPVSSQGTGSSQTTVSPQPPTPPKKGFWASLFGL